MAGKHRRPHPARPLAPTAAGATLGALTLLTGMAVTAPPPAVVPMVHTTPLEPVRFAYPPLSPAAAALYLAPLPPAPAAVAAPVATATVPPPAVETRTVTAAGASGGLVARVVTAALRQQGTPYVYGGTTPGRGLDCSGLVQFAYHQAGISLPRVAAAQATIGRPIPLSQVQAGDLLFYYAPISHVAIAAGNGMVIEASQPGTRIGLHRLYTNGLAVIKRVV